MKTSFIQIPMVDLGADYMRWKKEIDQAIQLTLESKQFIGGAQVQQFADDLAEYNQVRHVITCANGTDALSLALMALDIRDGDEIIVPSFTYFASAEVIALKGAVPVFVDVDPETYTIDPEDVRAAITEKTRAIIVVHLYGQCADMEVLNQLANHHGIPLIEDGAQSIGSLYSFSNGMISKSGTMGAIGTTSFFPTKNLGAYGDGGALFTGDDVLGEKLKMLANHGQSKKYYHDLIGINSRLDAIQAAILSVKLKYLDRSIEHRNEIANHYDYRLSSVSGIIKPVRSPRSTHVFHQYTVRILRDRDKIQNNLLERGIQTVIYYPLPVHKQKAFKDIGRISGSLKHTELLTGEVLSLPINGEITKDQVDYVCDNLIDLVE